MRRVRTERPVLRLPIVLMVATILVLVSAFEAAAQLPRTRLDSLFPPGGKVGTTFDVTVTSGADLDEIDKLHFNHPGIKAVQKTTGEGDKKQPVTNAFTVTIAGNVPPGLYDVRTSGLFGASNPRTFVVGIRNEIQEIEPNNTVDKATPFELGSTVNGKVAGTADVDILKFKGKKGQRVIATCHAARIDSKMAATIELLDSSGRQLAYGRNQIRRDPLVDVTLPADGDYFLKVYDFTYRGVNSNDFVYRLTAHTGPHIDYIMPPAGVANTTAKYTLYGRNLPGGKPAGVAIEGRPLEKLDVQITLPQDATTLQSVNNLTPTESGIDGITYILKTPAGNSNPVLVQFASVPVAIEQEPNDTPDKANKITAPGEFAGQFQARGDIDYVTFDAKAGDIYYVEVFGQRNGSSVDPYFILERVTVDKNGVEKVSKVVSLDDNTTNLAANLFDTASDDPPAYKFQVPGDGTYRISLRDRYFEARGDPRLLYRLAIRKAQPDFRLIAIPYVPPIGKAKTYVASAIGLRKGDNFGLHVIAFRRDGYNGTIDLAADGLPKGVTCKGASIGPGQTSTLLIITAAENAPEWFGNIRVLGKARIDDPDKVLVVASAQKAIKPATDALPKLSQAAQQATEKLNVANAQMAAALEALKKKPDDKGLQKKAADTAKAAATATDVLKKANAAKTAGDKKLADAQAALNKAQAEQTAAAKDVTRIARAATIVWGTPQTPAVSRVSRTLGLSVLKESAPFQVTTDVFKVEANQSRQILIPVKLIKRTGFDADVALTFTGLPSSSRITVQNKPIKKGKTAELLRLFVNNNAPEGTYTLYLKTQAAVPYRRNPAKAERAKAKQAVAVKAATAAANVAKQVAKTRTAAVKKATADAATLKNATTAKANADKASKTAADVLKKVTQEKAVADKAVVDTAAAAKAAAENAAKAKKTAEADATNKGLTDARAAAEKAAADAAAAAKKAADAKAAADKKFTDTQNAAKKATDALTAAEKVRVAADAVSKTSADAKTKAEAAAKDADAKSKAAAAAKTAADKASAAAVKAADAKTRNTSPPSTPIVITVKKAPVTLAASVPGGGNLKRGAKLEVKVTVKRINGFQGPVALTLPLPPGVVGVSSAPVTIPADKNDGVLVVQAAGNATEGQLANMVIRGVMQFNGKAAVDVAVTIKIAK